MAETVAGLVDTVRSEASFDIAPDKALAWLNRRHKAMVTEARALRFTASLTTVAGQRDYVLPGDLVEIEEVSVAGVVYGRGWHTDLAAGAQGYLVLSGTGGIVTSEETSTGAPEIALFPTPTQGGQPILVRAIWAPSDLSTQDDSTLRVPGRFIDGLISGAIATGLKRQEFRPDLAQAFEDEFASAVEQWRRQVARRYRGTGPAVIRVAGINA